MDKKYQVFVSSTYTDLIEERNEVMKALLELDCIPTGMELFPSGDETAWEYIKKVIDNCDYFIVISAGKYGTIAKDGKSYTQLEYEYAASKKIPSIAFLHQDLDKLSIEKSEKQKNNQQKLICFRNLLKKKLCRFWNNKHDLSALVSRSIVKLINDKPAIGWTKALNVNIENGDEQYLKLLSEINLLKEFLKSNTYVKSLDKLPKIRPKTRATEKNKVELGVLGILYSKTQSGAYSLVFDNNVNDKKISIIIGGFEAQSIAIELEGLIPPRPLTHDFIKKILDSLGLKIHNVLIDKHEKGVFSSIITLTDGLSSFELDSRTSDAIAIALRCKAPVYTYLEIINAVGVSFDFEKEKEKEKENEKTIVEKIIERKQRLK